MTRFAAATPLGVPPTAPIATTAPARSNKRFAGIKGKRLKLFYITQVAVKPPTFVIFVNDKELMHFSYVRYLENKIRDTFGFKGTSLKFIIRERQEKER